MIFPDDYIEAIGVDPYQVDSAGIIYHGDCFDILARLPERSIDLVVTDPPYDLNINYYKGGIAARENVKVFKNIKHGFQHDFNPSEFLPAVAPAMRTFNGYFWCNVKQLIHYLNFSIDNSFVYDVLTWHKNNAMPLTNNGLLPDTEYCVYIRQSGACFNNRLNKNHYAKYWVTSRQLSNGHPTPKPPKIMSHHILVSSPAGGVVLDPYMGSGTTLVGSKQLDRKFIGIDIKEEYCKLAIELLAQEVMNI